MIDKSLFHDFFWKLLYALPILAYLALCLSHTSTVVPFAEYISAWVPDFMMDAFSSVFDSLFSSDGLVPLSAYKIAVPFSAYYFSCFCVHLLTDVIMFIPKLSMKILDRSCKL